MGYLKKRRYSDIISNDQDDDPLAGVANLFDVGLVFIVGLILALVSAYQMMDIFSEDSEITIMKKDKQGSWEIITKKGKEIKIEKISDQKVGGKEGMRLGTAYKLKNGKVIYVPDKGNNNGKK